MGVGSGTGTSETLTQDAAAAVFEGLLSQEEKGQDQETPQEEVEQPEVEGADPSDDPEEESEPSEQADPEEQSDDDEVDVDEEVPTPKKFKVKADGQELEVDEDELVKGYSRTADYTKKTQALAEARRKFETEELPSLREERQRAAVMLGQLEEALKSAVPNEPDWEALKQDPAAYTETRIAWDKYQEQLKAVSTEREKAQQKVAEDQVQIFKATLENEKSQLISKLPEWVDESVAKKEKGELVEFAKSLGYTDADVARVYDHRLILLLRKAMLHERAEKAKPKVREQIEKVRAATPGPKRSTPPKKVSEVTKAKQRLARSGSVKDAAAAIELMLD